MEVFKRMLLVRNSILTRNNVTISCYILPILIPIDISMLFDRLKQPTDETTMISVSFK